MAIQTSFLKKLVKEDFDQKDQALIGKIGFVLNPVIQQITSVLNKGLSLGNLSDQIKTITVIVDENGIPTNNLVFTSILTSKCIGILVLRAQNLTNPTTYPKSGPFVSFTENSGQIQILNITGLTSGDNWQLSVVAFN